MALDRRSFLAAATLIGAAARFPALAASAPLSARHRALIDDLVARMTPAEKFGQMTQLAGGRQKALNSRIDAAALDAVRRGEVGSYLHVAGAEPLLKLQKVAVEESRLKVPLLFAMDVIHGYRTTMPVPIALAATFDPEIVRQTARIAAIEASVSGLHWTFAPMVDVARDPRWGRVVEGAGEDPYLGSRMAEAQILGFQTADLAGRDAIMACAKHFGAYGAAAGGRDYDSADVSQRTLNEVYLPPFHAAASAGAASFMTAFNDIAGVPTTANADLVRHQLRDDWGYQGLVVSDWNAIAELIAHGVAASPVEAAALALRAGVDMDMTSGVYAAHLPAAVAADPALMPLVDQAVGRILAVKARLGLFDAPYRFGDAKRETALLGSNAHRAVAREAAVRSIVLLRNEGALLPLKPGAKIALIGALADDARSTIGSWKGRGIEEDSITLRAALSPVATVSYSPGAAPRSDDMAGIAAAVDAARASDIILLAIGEDWDHSGESRSRADIGLPGAQMALLEALKATGKPIVAVLMNGRPLALERALKDIPAVLETWFLGNEAGPAIADVLTGRVSPGGRLPMGIPRTSGAVPYTYAHNSTGRPADPDPAKDTARYHDSDVGALFPFGHGLGYGEIAYAGLEIDRTSVPADGQVRIACTVTNSGTRASDEVVQLYLRDPVASVARPVRELRGFARVPLAPGQARRVTFTVSPAQMAIWTEDAWVVEPGRIEVMIGASSQDIRLTGAFAVTGTARGRAPAAALATATIVA